MQKKVEIEEGESDGPLDKPSLRCVQNTAIKVINDVLVKLNVHNYLSEVAADNWIG